VGPPAKRLGPILISVGCLVAVALLVYLVIKFGSTETVTTTVGDQTSTITESNALALAVVAGLITLLSAALTATLAHWYATKADRERRTADQRAERSRRAREQVAAVGNGISAMLESVRPFDEDFMSAGALDGAQIHEGAMFAVRQAYYKALPDIEMLDDADLRDAASKAFTLREAWFGGSSDALLNNTPQPPMDEVLKSRDLFFERARAYIVQIDKQ
jgi:hypothetical protein